MRLRVSLFVATCLCAALAVPAFYAVRSEILFVGGVALFVGAPLIVGAIQGEASRISVRIAIALLAFCPVIYAITDGLPGIYERPRDVYFLVTGTTVVFVGAEWAAHYARSNRLARLLGAGTAIVVGATANFVMIWMYMYFE